MDVAEWLRKLGLKQNEPAFRQPARRLGPRRYRSSFGRKGSDERAKTDCLSRRRTTNAEPLAGSLDGVGQIEAPSRRGPREASVPSSTCDRGSERGHASVDGGEPRNDVDGLTPLLPFCTRHSHTRALPLARLLGSDQRRSSSEISERSPSMRRTSTFGARRWLVSAALGGILVLAAWLRIVAVEETAVYHPIRADAKEYYLSAYNLVFEGTYSRSAARLSSSTAPLPADAYRYPGLPLVIAPFILSNYRTILLTGPTVDVGAVLCDVQIVNVAAGVAAVALVFFAASVALPSWAALGAALLTAISPHLVSFTVYLLTEPIAAMLTCLLLAAAAAVAR